MNYKENFMLNLNPTQLSFKAKVVTSITTSGNSKDSQDRMLRDIGGADTVAYLEGTRRYLETELKDLGGRANITIDRNPQHPRELNNFGTIGTPQITITSSKAAIPIGKQLPTVTQHSLLHPEYTPSQMQTVIDGTVNSYLAQVKGTTNLDCLNTQRRF